MKLVHFLFFLFFFGLNANAFIAEPSSEKDSINEKCRYKWTQGGMLKKVIRPDKKHVDFTYDALGRRLTKTYKDQTTHFVWDGNVPLHEWTSGVDDAISHVNEEGEREIITPENLTTWVFEDGTFIPMAKLQGENSYSIITDHLGTPTEAYDEDGKKVWSRQLNIYGETRKETGFENFIPFLYQGQYIDTETELAYNRFRYYDPSSGTYISQDPIGLAGGMPNMYSYVLDLNVWTDPLGLTYHGPKPTYENPGHHQPGHPNFRGGGAGKTSIIPKNAADIYKNAIPDAQGKHWYAKTEDGTIHRFGNSNDGKVHWNGDSKQGPGLSKVPKEVNARFNKPNGYRPAPNAKC